MRHGSSVTNLEPPTGMSLETMIEAIRIIDAWDNSEERDEESLVKALFNLFSGDGIRPCGNEPEDWFDRAKAHLKAQSDNQ